MHGVLLFVAALLALAQGREMYDEVKKINDSCYIVETRIADTSDKFPVRIIKRSGSWRILLPDFSHARHTERLKAYQARQVAYALCVAAEWLEAQGA